MNKYVKDFLLRGLAFGGFGPIVGAIILFVISKSMDKSFSGTEVLMIVVSTYLLAFIQAGASVFNQIEKWSIPKSVGCHLGSIYIAYLGCYLINSWIPFNWSVVIIFTAIFIASYFAIWFIVYFIVKMTTKEMNKKLG